MRALRRHSDDSSSSTSGQPNLLRRIPHHTMNQSHSSASTFRRTSLTTSVVSSIHSNHTNSIDKPQRQQNFGGMARFENMEEELLRTKKSHAFAMREIGIMRTRLKVLEKECKKKDQQIDELVKDDPGSKSEQKLRQLSLKRKVIQYERALREKSEEVAKLLSDRNVAKAAETRQRMEKLETECSRLKRHLNESVPEADFLKEKDQYMDIIANLTEENMQMRQIIGKYQSEKSEEILRDADHDLTDETLIKNLKNYALSQKAGAQQCRKALDRLLKQRNAIQHKPVAARSVSAAPLRRKIMQKRPLAKTQSEATKDRSKSTDFALGRVSQQQMSAPEYGNDEEGKEFMLPTNFKGYAMYRNAIDSEDSSIDEEEPDQDQNAQNGTINYMESEPSSGSDLPQELYDAKGRIYLLEMDEVHGDGVTTDYMHDLPDSDGQLTTEDSVDDGDDVTLVGFKKDDNDVVSGRNDERLEEVRNRLEIIEIESDGPTQTGVMESWFQNADVTEHKKESAVTAFVRAVKCHVLRQKMANVRK
ncbi:unnamed protein product [Bursaphelenchus okinawaensis]|uniref:Uncharacterized protein n=1 Tax=Bursaphelenchus okinawaensis TaxID=465554 RepID=A0A811KG00_9BILA|nr:unnamed protein product [Bursaphelenchus okinawaensis]CAG9102126.1 unnamed protein product [Bursaphelenchus okinawaensis]